MASKRLYFISLLMFLRLSEAGPVTNKVARAEEDPESYRLNQEVTPSLYEIDLTLPDNFGVLGTFTGNVKITFRAAEGTQEIKLHFHQLRPNLLTVRIYSSTDPNKSNLRDSDVQYEAQQMIGFKLNMALKSNIDYVIEISYNGLLADDMKGFYRSSYINEQGTVEWIATTQFQPTHARRAFPCFDEPNMKAIFEIHITHPSEYHAISNTRAQEVAPGPTATSTKTSFIRTPRMSTYLIAFIVSKYVSIKGTFDDIDHALWSPAETIGSGAYAFSMAPRILQVMKDFTNIPYAASGLPKLDQASIPDFSAGAMENWGLVTYRETALLWDAADSSARNKQRVGTVVAHELAHSWFGNLITLDWWSATWLNEGFARYFEYHATAEVETTWELDKQFVVEQHQAILNTDSFIAVQPLTSQESDVYTPSQVSSKFGTITYSKGGSVIRMMKHFLGPDNFLKGIQAYLSSNQFSNTVPKDLWDKLSENSASANLPATVEDIMKLWTEQGGFPLVTVTRNGNNLVLTQKRFLFSDASNDNAWYIPITYTTSAKKDFATTVPSAWMNPNQPSATISNIWNDAVTWVVINIQASGYYRVNYDDSLWDALQEALRKENFDGIGVLNRAQIVDDAMNLARAGVIKYKRAFDIIHFLENETEYYPWYPTFTSFAYLRRRLDSTSEIAKLLNNYVSHLMEKLYASVQESDSEGQIQTHKKVLATTWACDLGNEDCIAKALESFKNLKENQLGINPNLRSSTYCTALRHSTDEEADWKFLWNKYGKTRSAAEISVLISALGCTKNETLLNKYLEYSISSTSGIRRQDAQSVFTAVISGNPEGVAAGFEFLKSKYAAIAANYGGMNALSSVISGLADRLTTQQQVTEFQAFIATNKEQLKDAAEVAESAIENAIDNLEWVNSFSGELLEYLQEHDDGSGVSAVTASSVITVLSILYSIFI